MAFSPNGSFMQRSSIETSKTSVEQSMSSKNACLRKFVIYTRCSTIEQSRSGLGLEAQRVACERFVEGQGGTVIRSYVEIASGGNNERLQVVKALTECEITGATLVVSRLCRLSRDVGFIDALIKRGTRFTVVEMPNHSEMSLYIHATCNQEERRLISVRTREALAVRKRQGKALGGFRGRSVTVEEAAKGTAARVEKARARARLLGPIITELRAAGNMSKTALAKGLNARHIRTPRGGEWSSKQVGLLLSYLNTSPAGIQNGDTASPTTQQTR
jgi:DNA invertase Pin-like site-specific DNA recombinase